MSREPVSGLEWLHAVRDSSDLVVAAKAVKYRRDKFGEDVYYVAPQTVKLVAVAYGTFMDKDGVARVGVQTICKRFRLSAKTVRAAKLVIARAGWWEVEPGGGAGRTDVIIARIPASATFYKTGDPGTCFPDERGEWLPERGERLPPKSKEEEELSLGGEQGPTNQLVGEGTQEAA